jgi:hypothetical protein
MALGAWVIGHVLGVLSGCGDPPALRPLATRELGALRWDPAVGGRDGGYSGRVGDRALWVFGDTGGRTRPGHLGFANNTACVTADGDARDGLFPMEEKLDPDGYLLEFLPLTADEAAYERAHADPATCGDACEGVALWPGPVIHDPARRRVLIVYAKLYQRPGPLDITVVGTSLAVWDASLAGTAVRPVVAPDSDEPTLLFRAGEGELAAAALAVDDTLLAYTCAGDGFDAPCRLARAPLADPLRRAAWEFWGGSGWSPAWSDAAELFQGAPMMTVHWNAHGAVWVATYARPAGNEVAIRTAPRPEGPWSDEAVIHAGREPLVGSTSYGGLMHPELSRDGGKIEYLTYYLHETGTIELVEVAWE